MKSYYIGFATTFHDPAVAIVDDSGQVIFAEASERHLQHKRALAATPDDTVYLPGVIAEHCDPHARFVVASTWGNTFAWGAGLAHFFGRLKPQRIVRAAAAPSPWTLLEAYQNEAKYCLQAAATLRPGLHFATQMRLRYNNQNLSFRRFSHHLTHAANAVFTSPFRSGTCLIVDGLGETGWLSAWRFDDVRLTRLKRTIGTASLGLFYEYVTRLCGFDSWAGEEWKLMGLAAYGQRDQHLYELFERLIQVRGLQLKLAAKRHQGPTLTELSRVAKDPAMRAHLAHTAQAFFADKMTEILASLYQLAPATNLILGGGCALNSSYNGEILARTPFKQLFVPSAPADDGNALGAALLAYKAEHPEWRRGVNPGIKSPYLGTRTPPRDLAGLLTHGQLAKLSVPGVELSATVARLLAAGKVIGWMQGRAEFGPRSLGNRAILADPRPKTMREHLNQTVKYREEFRPFAPAILHEYGPEYFTDYQESPYMERTLQLRPEVRSRVPAICHVDGSGRLQSVRREGNAAFYELILAFFKLTGVPMLLNTSLNVMGKPMVHSLHDALGVFYTSGLDALVIEEYLLEK